MEIITIYGITLGSIFLSLAFIRALYYLSPLKNVLSVLISKHFTYPYIFHRHLLIGPWTPAGVLMNVCYFAANLLCLLVFVSSASDLARRAGELSLVNMPFLFAAPNLGFLADILGISLHVSRKIHHSVALMSIFLLIIHISVMILAVRPVFLLQDDSNLFALIVSLISMREGYHHLT